MKRDKAHSKTISLARGSITNARAKIDEVNARINNLRGMTTPEGILTVMILEAEVRSLKENILRAEETIEQAEMQL